MSVSFKTLRRLIANEIEPTSWAIGTSTGTGSSSAITCSDFAFTSGDNRALDGGWAYWTSGALLGQERPVVSTGLDTGTGGITLANPYTATTPDDAEFEIHLRYPVKRSPGTLWVSGYQEMVNDALRRLWFEDWISVLGVSSQQRYLLDLTTYPWLANRSNDRVFDVYGPRDATSNVRNVSPYTWHIDDDAEAPELVFDSGGYTTGDTFYLKVARPCHTRIKIAGVWTDVSDAAPNNGVVGLAADADEVHAIESHVMALAITESMNHLGMRQPAVESAIWEQKRQYWAQVARGIKNRRLPRKHDGRLRLQVAGLGGGMMGRGGGTGWSKGWG